MGREVEYGICTSEFMSPKNIFRSVKVNRTTLDTMIEQHWQRKNGSLKGSVLLVTNCMSTAPMMLLDSPLKQNMAMKIKGIQKDPALKDSSLSQSEIPRDSEDSSTNKDSNQDDSSSEPDEGSSSDSQDDDDTFNQENDHTGISLPKYDDDDDLLPMADECTVKKGERTWSVKQKKVQQLKKVLQDMLKKPGTILTKCQDGEFWFTDMKSVRQRIPKFFKVRVS